MYLRREILRRGWLMGHVVVHRVLAARVAAVHDVARARTMLHLLTFFEIKNLKGVEFE
jgi:hypothetical protein